LGWPRVTGLAEVMNYAGVLAGERRAHEMVKATLRAGKVVDGHAPGLSGRELSAYAAAGISSCHESISRGEALEKLRLGFFVMAREGSTWRDLSEVLKVVTEDHVETRRLLLVSDDLDPRDLLRDGHVDRLVRLAVQLGVDPVKAIQMATLNTAERFGLQHDVGSLSPGRCADILLINDLERAQVGSVYCNGVLTAKDGRLLAGLPAFDYPDSARNSVRLKRPIVSDDLVVEAPLEEGRVMCLVLGVIPSKTLTKRLVEELPARRRRVYADPGRDVAKIAVVERHRGTGNVGVGFVKGLGLREGAFASTVAHDSHNVLIVGAEEEDMAFAGNRAAKMGGGMVVARRGQVLAALPLPIAGLMSDRSVEAVAEMVDGLEQALSTLGVRLRGASMTMSLLSLPVIPELRVTDKGVVDVASHGLTKPVLQASAPHRGSAPGSRMVRL